MPDLVQTFSGVATVVAAVIAVIAAVVATLQLRSQASSLKLSSVIATNELWRLVQDATKVTVVLREATVRAVIEAHKKIGPNVSSVLDRNGAGSVGIEAGVPFVIGALQTTGIGDIAKAPESAASYRDVLVSRGRIVGYTLTCLAMIAEGQGPEATVVAEDLRALQVATEKYVNVVNEVAELYEANLVDRRLFLGKRHVSIIQQAYFVEPYVLWRNSVNPGRWGLRVLSIGQEARRYHCVQTLQHSAIRARVSPVGYGVHAGGYQGFVATVGWMLGPGWVSHGLIRSLLSERLARIGLGRQFWAIAKKRQNQAIAAMPRTGGSGYAPASNDRWEDFVQNPSRLMEDVRTVRGF